MGKVLTNIGEESDIIPEDIPGLPEGFDYYLYFDGEVFSGTKGGRKLDIYQTGSGYDMKSPSGPAPDISGMRLFLAVRKNIVRNPYAYSSLYSIRMSVTKARWIVFGFIET